MEITGQELKLSANETNKVIQGTLSSTMGSTLNEMLAIIVRNQHAITQLLQTDNKIICPL